MKKKTITKQERVLRNNMLEKVDEKKKLSQQFFLKRQRNDCICVLGNVRWY